MEITETERKILRVKAGAILILGMQMGSELQLDTEEKREDALMQLVAMQRLVEKAGYSPDLAFENCASHSRYFSDELDAQFF